MIFLVLLSGNEDISQCGILFYNTERNIKQNRKSCKVINHINQAIDYADIHNDRQFVTALARGLGILSVFENSNTSLSHNAICEKTQLPKATVSRLIYTLIKTGFLLQEADGSYRLGMGAVRISAAAWAQYDLVRHAQPMMSAFAAKHHVSVNLAKEENGQMLYLACCRSPARLAVQLTVGSHVPISVTAIGRAYYAVSDDISRQRLLRQLPEAAEIGVEKCRTLLTEHAQFYRQYGYTLSDREFSDDIMAVAVGVFDPAEQRYTHSLNASVPASRWQMDELVRDIVPSLQVLSEQISQACYG